MKTFYKAVDLFWRVFPILLIAGCVIAGVLLADKALGQTRLTMPDPGPTVDNTYTEIATYLAKTGNTPLLCWTNTNNNADGTEFKELQIAFRKYRMEGGAKETSQVLPYSAWTPLLDGNGTPVPRTYCAITGQVKKAGHWVYEAMMCQIPYVSDSESCSGWMSSIVPSVNGSGGGTVDGRPKGWWIYTFLPAPTGVGT